MRLGGRTSAVGTPLYLSSACLDERPLRIDWIARDEIAKCTPMNRIIPTGRDKVYRVTVGSAEGLRGGGAATLAAGGARGRKTAVIAG
ncbi:hypothetical protein EVAR_7262_1 [Eumeta japonica]|uniref:Uncharacterized protein n=1 Tax=Eumeta variegata TaxID=151549 RepID=A0A4C1T5W5_EUMVA|nr:hypothetical protein EVAR_7262_1 [Eumeta japonica]